MAAQKANKKIQPSCRSAAHTLERQSRQPADLGRYLAEAMHFVMQRVETIADLNQLRRQTFAVVFIWVDWAIHAHHSAHTAERMITDWNLKHPSMTMVLSRIDLSEQCGEMWHAVAEWIRSQSISDIGSLMYGGAGSIMWLRSGTIVRYVVNPNTETVSDLVVLMNQCFSGPEPSNAK